MRFFPRMSPATLVRRSHSRSPSPREVKRARIDHLTKESFKNGIFLAPMVRSGALPTRLFALKHGATLVWSPETIDKAILHAERAVDPVTGVISYNGKSKAIFQTHPLEKPYLIYQIGSADPDLAVQAAKVVMQDVSGFDLNCGCPKPFSTHAGMGAALLTNPDLLCAILTALRTAMPPEITVSAKIRLLPTQEETLKLVERIVNTGVSALTVHCRTRSMRDKDRALTDRLREIVDFVAGMGKDIAVIENGDCLGYEDSKRVIQETGASSVMIARAAEANPSCFSPRPLQDLEETFIPAYLRLARYVDTHWSLAKFCLGQFKGSGSSSYSHSNKENLKRVRQAIVASKGYEDVSAIAGEWTGAEELNGVEEALKLREATAFSTADDLEDRASQLSESTLDDADVEDADEAMFVTPTGTQNPHPPVPRAPLVSDNPRILPAFVLDEDPPTPTMTPAKSYFSLSSLNTHRHN